MYRIIIVLSFHYMYYELKYLYAGIKKIISFIAKLLNILINVKYAKEENYSSINQIL